MRTVRVRFKGEELFWIDIGGHGALAPLHHIDKDGAVKIEALFETSYAYVLPSGDIVRFGEVIGAREDLEEQDDL